MENHKLIFMLLIMTLYSYNSLQFNDDPFEDECCKFRYQFSKLEACCQGDFSSLCCNPLKALHGQSWKACGGDMIGDCEVTTYRVNGKVLHREVKHIIPEDKSSFLSGNKDLYDWKKSRKNKMNMYLPDWYAQNGVKSGNSGRTPPFNYLMGNGGNGSDGESTYNGNDAGQGGNGGNASQDHQGKYLGNGGQGGDGGHAYGGGNAGHGGQGGDGLIGGEGGDGGDVFFNGYAGNGGTGGNGNEGGSGGEGGNAFFGGIAGNGGPGGNGGDTYFGGKAGNGGPGGHGGHAWFGGEAGDGGEGGNGGNAYYGGVPGEGGEGGIGGQFYPDGPESQPQNKVQMIQNHTHQIYDHHHGHHA